jgi:hypothetical protein
MASGASAVRDTRGRTIEWAALSLTQGEILDAFALYCRDALDEVEVLLESPNRLELGWRRERSTIEIGTEIPERDEPILLLTELKEALITHLLDDAALRARVAVYDLARLEKASAVRSSIFVHFEWFLRDVYGVKLVASDAFTRGLVDRGIISLGFG